MGMARKSDDGRRWLLLAGHFREGGVPQQETRQRLAILLQHFRRTCGVEERLQEALRENSVLVEVLDHVKEAVAMVDALGRAVRANKAAMAIFRRGVGVSLARDERIVAATSEARSMLAKALSQCLSPLIWISGGDAGPPTQIIVPRVDQSPLVLTLQPLSKEHGSAFGAVALLFISDPDAKLPDRSAAMRAAYSLTPAEAKLMQALVEGRSLKEIGYRHQITYETVRTCLRRVLEKTGAKRQSDLVRIAHLLR